MFFYTHVLTDSYKENIFTSSSSSNIPPGDTVSFSESASASSNKTIAAGSLAQETIAAAGNTAPEYDFDSNGNFVFVSYGVTDLGPSTEIVSTTYSYGTAPRSVTQRTATRTTIVGTFNSSATFTIGPAGSSTGVDSISYTIPATATTVKTQVFSTIGSGTATTVLSATASATDTTTGTVTVTLASATTLVPFFALSMQTVQRWYEARQNPPPLRRAGIAFAATHGSSTGLITDLAAGSNAFLSDLSITTSSSSSEIIAGGTQRTHVTYFVGNKGSYTHSTATSVLSAARRMVSTGFYHDGSLFAGASYSPSVGATWTGGVSVASGLKSASIFTTPEADSNTTYLWFYDGTSWLLLATSSNTATTSAYTITYTFTGTPSTTTLPATHGIGVTTAILGPIQPFTTSSLNVISLSTQNTGGASAFFTGRNSSTAGSSSASASISSSQTYAIGSATDDQPATFPASDLSYAVAHVAASVSTQLSSGFSGIPGATFDAGSIPSLFSAAKWNEAGRGDAVSVNQ